MLLKGWCCHRRRWRMSLRMRFFDSLLRPIMELLGVISIAMAVMAATDQVDGKELDQYIMMGELSLDGSLRPIKGALPIAIETKRTGFKGLILPMANAREAAIVEGIDVLGASKWQCRTGD